ncbi:MAG: glutamine-hydrolyzing carbamoyl-phosphate synthase small subunit [Coriobacteriia bacterium]|nr:glutamine-hydrolyzing carbamoyl-phosphate synthase small subunit [Coriobacteriia bacterium]
MVFTGMSCGAEGETTGELCFNTSMTGYQEILTDPSYAGQIVTMTMPQIGNYGTNPEDVESRGIFARGLVVREMCFEPSNWRSTSSLPHYLIDHGIVAIQGLDTREIVLTLRESGAMKACLSTIDSNHDSLVAKAKAAPGLVGRDLVKEVCYGKMYTFDGSVPDDLHCVVEEEKAATRYNVVAFDSGIKYNILRSLAALGCAVTVVPPTMSSQDVLALNPDGIFLSNGPGDPDAVDYLSNTVKELLGKKPIFGICLGHQMLSLAVGASTFKLKYGHRGGNHPVKNLDTGKVEITSQNHGFCVDFASIGSLQRKFSPLGRDANDLASWSRECVSPVVMSKDYGEVRLTHVNLNDMSVEGIDVPGQRAYSVQYHPEASPGPHDAHYLFKKFISLMQDA